MHVETAFETNRTKTLFRGILSEREYVQVGWWIESGWILSQGICQGDYVRGRGITLWIIKYSDVKFVWWGLHPGLMSGAGGFWMG